MFLPVLTLSISRAFTSLSKWFIRVKVRMMRREMIQLERLIFSARTLQSFSHRLSSECSRLSTGYNRVAVVTCQIVTRSSNYPAAAPGGASERARRRGMRLLADRVQRVPPEEKWGGRARALENGAGAKIGAIEVGRYLNILRTTR